MSAITEAIKKIEGKYLNDKTKLIPGTGMISLIVGILHIMYEEAEKEKPLVLCEHCGDMCIEKDV